MGSVYRLTLRQVSSRGRLLLMTVLALLPVLLTLLMLRDDDGGSIIEFEQAIIGAMLCGSIAPLVVLAIAAPAFANELEDRTLANLTLAPLARWQIALPKLLATITLAAPFIGLSALATSWLAYLGDPRSMLAVTGAALAGVALYASAFVWLGLVSTQAIGLGLLYIVLWEGFFAGFVAGVRLFSIRYHAIALMHGLDARLFDFDDHLGTIAVATIAVLLFGGFLWLAVRRLRRMDVP